MELDERYKMLSTNFLGEMCMCHARATDLHAFCTLSCLVGVAGHLDEPTGFNFARYMGNTLGHAAPVSLAPCEDALHVPEADSFFHRGFYDFWKC